MIYLRTGANGTCKTLFTLKDVREKQLKEGRPVCWNGRFKLKPELEAEWGWKRIDFKDWQDQQDGTIFLIDECHNDMPKRSSGSAVPPHIAKMAEHRARGFDFFLISQHPGNVDSFVTKLIGAPGWHQHLKRIAGGSKLTSVLQWDAVNPTCERNGSAKTAQVSTRSQPKEVYAWYDSAELHTEKVRIPKTWIVIGAAVVLVPLVGIMGFKTMWSATTSKASKTDKEGPALVASAPAETVRPAPVLQPAKAQPMTVAEYASSVAPRFEGFPNTASRYDEIARPVHIPYPAACITMKSKGCRCYTQQGTLIPVIKPETCEQIVANGFFVDWQQSGGIGGETHDGDNYRRSGAVPIAGVAFENMKPSSRPDKQDGVGITAADIARTSVARTGNNVFAHQNATSDLMKKPN